MLLSTVIPADVIWMACLFACLEMRCFKEVNVIEQMSFPSRALLFPAQYLLRDAGPGMQVASLSPLVGSFLHCSRQILQTRQLVCSKMMSFMKYQLFPHLPA